MMSGTNTWVMKPRERRVCKRYSPKHSGKQWVSTTMATLRSSRTLPEYWKILVKETKGKKLTKTAIHQGKAPVKTSNAEYFKQVHKIAKGELHKLSWPRSMPRIWRMLVWREMQLMQFALVDKCEVLQNKAQQVLEKKWTADTFVRLKNKHPSVRRRWRVWWVCTSTTRWWRGGRIRGGGRWRGRK